VRGAVSSIHIAFAGAAPIISLGEIQAIAGKGLEGDRYYLKTGTYSKTPGTGREVTLIEIEAIEALTREYGIDIDAAQARRNIVTRGVALNRLVDRICRRRSGVTRHQALRTLRAFGKTHVQRRYARIDSSRRLACRRGARRGYSRRRYD
jgi:hypothetical protein